MQELIFSSVLNVYCHQLQYQNLSLPLRSDCTVKCTQFHTADWEVHQTFLAPKMEKINMDTA